MTGADRQWRLNRENFEGCWQGASQWYLRDGAPPLDLTRPSRVIADTRYAISFQDADTGLWDGSGLLFAPDGRRQLPLSRQTYNQGGSCWQFLGAGGQSSLRVDAGAPRFGHEINLFDRRSRSMLVLLWDRQAAGGPLAWRLSAVAAVPFRCSLSQPQDPPRSALAAADLLATAEGWPGTLEVLVPGQWPADDPEQIPAEPFSAAGFARHPCTAALADGLVFSVPETLPAGAFRLEAGCLLSPKRFHQISLLFNARQQLSRLELRRFSPPAG